MIENQHSSFYLQSVPVSDAYVGKSRLEVLRGYCENKKVLHIGCVDYPVTQLADNLHLQLAPFCATLDGYDIHTEVYPTLKPYIQNGRFLYSLAEADDYDVVIIPEVLEHIGDVPSFLREMAKISAKKFLITVPDLFQCFNRHFEYLGKNQIFLEAIHPDHNCWYSPYTISNIIKKYTPWRVADIHFFNQISLLVVADSIALKQDSTNESALQLEQPKQPKKILLAVDFFWPSVGGLEKQTQAIATHLSAKGHQVTIATGELADRKEHKYQNNPIISLSRASVPGQPYPKATEQLRQLIASGDYDACILLADPLNWVIWSLESGNFPPQTRIIVQPIINDQGYASWRNNAAFRQRLCGALKKADHVIAFNPQGPDAHFLLEEHLLVDYIPNACSPVESAENFRAEMGIEEGRFLLLHVANFFPVKNHLGLIDALANIPEDWLFVMIGHPADTDYFQAVSKRIAGAKNIKLIPGLPPAKVQAAIKAADVVLLSSLGEGFPTTLLEAMASGKPWLATPTCGAANQLTGGLIAPLDQFPNLLACLATTPQLRQRLGEIGYSHWRQCFNWETVITRWEELIQQGRITKDISPLVETVKQQQDILEELNKLLKKTNGNNPLVSVIITTFNRPALLLDAVNSVLAQTYRPIEIIVINDCGQSVESELSVLDTQIPISCIRHGVNRGLSAARNSGIVLARGEIICFLDDDDRFLPHHLQTAVTALSEPGVDLVYTDAVYVREQQLENGERHELARGEPFKGIPYNREHLLVENFVPVNTWALRRTLALRAGPFEENYTALEDWEFLLRLTALTAPKPIAQTTVEVRVRTDLSEHMSGRERERFLPLYQRIYQKHPTSSAHVQAGRDQMLTALAGERANANFTEQQPLPALSYPAWRAQQRWPASAVARLADQIAPLVTAGAGVHILLMAATNEHAAVADTLDTLAAQATAGWRLTVISPYPCPDPLFTTLPALAWLQLTAAEALPTLLDQAVAASPLDWLMVCAPGIRFEPTFAALTVATAAKQSTWRCLYFDEDRLDSTGQPADPRLKPDIDPELLYGSAYVGQAVLVHRALWPTLDHRLAAWPRAFAFDAALRALEMGGEAAIGHIDELAVSLPANADGETADWLPMANGLLSAHLTRQHETAALYPGLLPDTLFVDYPLTHWPLVSIIVSASAELEPLRLCLDHLLNKTEYRHFEVWVAGHGVADAVTVAYLDDLSQQDARIKRLPDAVAGNPSTIRNQTVALASGEFLLLLDGDIVAVQPNWLDRLLAHGLRAGVGVVGGRLVSPQGRIRQAGLILGLSGGVEPIGFDEPMATPGHLGRGQQVQNFSAVSAACLLIRRDLYQEIGGLDERHFPDAYADVDLCLQVRVRGLRVVWTPFATLIQATGNAQSANAADPDHQAAAERAALALTQRWSPWLSADPAYNRRLSLARPDWSLDNTLLVPWNPRFETLPCVLAAPYDDESTSHYRLRDPLAALAAGGQARHALLPDYARLKPEFLDPVALERTGMAVFLFQDAFGFDRITKLRAALPHCRIVLTQNDAMTRIAARHHIPCTPEDADTLRQAEHYLRQTLAFCDRLIVADPALAEAFGDLIDDIRIVPNYLPRQRWETLTSRRGQGAKPRIGWLSGVGQSATFAFMRAVIEATYDVVDWILLGSCPENIRPLLAEHHPVVPFQDYPTRLAGLDLDLAVIPPAFDPFTASDNRLRLLEYGVLGWPVLCSENDGHDPDAPVSRLPNDAPVWIDAIRERARDLPTAWRQGDLLQSWVHAHRMLEDHLDEWRDALFVGFGAPPPSLLASPPQAESVQSRDRAQPVKASEESPATAPDRLPVSTAGSVRLEETVPTPPVSVTLSVVICSIDNARFHRIARQYHHLLSEIPHEIIRIDDASSLCEGYNRGIARSRGDYLIFSHDDLEIWTPDFGHRLLQHLERCDVVGVAGTNWLTDTGGQTALWKYTSWGAAGLGHVFGRMVQRQGDAYAVVVYGTPAPLVEGIQALDGAFIAVRRHVVEALSFDAETFDGFHLYDLDFSYRAFRQGFRLGVFTDIAILHESAGDYDAVYFNYHRRFLQKFAGDLPTYRPRPWQHAFMVFDCPEEVLDFYAGEGEAQPFVAAKTTAKASEATRETGTLSDNGLYRHWCERQQVGEGWAEIVGERMVKHWRTQPTFHLVIWCEPSQITALADTLESLGRQLYSRWGVSILAPFDCPDGAFTDLANVEWIKVAADADAALRQALDDSALDWFALLEPGDRLAAHALLKIADYSNRYPDWRFIYLDEDQLDLRGERRDPIFRPEFDPELLLGTHYLGDCCLIRRDSMPTDSNLPYLPGVTTFQAALAVWERYGVGAVGHLADVLYHRAASRLPVADPDTIANARRRLVTDFLSRRQIAATVEATLLPGAWRIAYQHPRQPKVSIIVLAKDALDRLDRCLRKLLAKTAYPDYEVLVVDCGSEAEDTFDLYAELAERYPDRFRWIVATGPLSVTAYRNQGAHEAHGEVLLFLTGSALVVQAGWIERLLNHALREEIGIVGARLTTPDAVRPFVYGTAQLLGLRGLTGPLFSGLSLKAPGPQGRAQVDQTVSAVSADCLMIRREIFDALGGFDPAYTVNHADIDLCLRAAARGYRTLWTPFANLAWLGEYPLATGGDHPSDVAAKARSDAEHLFERWLPQLANDPAYNRNLSLAEAHRVEVELAPGWDTAFHDRPRILGFPADETGCALYRIYAPLWLLEHQAQAECTLIKSGARPPELAELERLAPDTVFYQGMIADLGIAAMRQYRRFHRSFKVFDLDDLKHNVPDANSLKERLVRDVKHRHRQALAQCDRLIVSTEPLAEACRPWIADIRVVPNRLERARWGHLKNRRRIGPKPRVGWAGAQQHHGDLAFISEVVKQTAAEVDWIFFGMCLEDVRPYVKEVHGWVHLNDYPAKLASLDLDLAVAPLELHPFNEAKSNLRILEHGILGRPMICTDIYPYRNAPVQQVANDTAAWVAAIRERIHDLDAAEREGDALRAWVLEHYILDDHTADWLRALQP